MDGKEVVGGRVGKGGQGGVVSREGTTFVCVCSVLGSFGACRELELLLQILVGRAEPVVKDRKRTPSWKQGAVQS